MIKFGNFYPDLTSLVTHDFSCSKSQITARNSWDIGYHTVIYRWYAKNL